MSYAQDFSVDRKYQIFISSTFKDLQEHRVAAMKGIIKAGHLPLALENFPPDTKDKATVIQTAIKSCQFYVLILGHCYGSRPIGKDGKQMLKGYVEMELDWAEKAGLQILAFLIDEDIAREKRNKLRRPKDEEELVNEGQYWNFRKRFTEGIHQCFYKPFTMSDDIYTELFAYFSKEHAVQGYILEPEDKAGSDVLQIYAKNEILRTILERLGKFGTLEKRMSEALMQKEALAKTFHDLHGDDIVLQKCEKIFIESGSTTGYIAKHLAPKLPKRAVLTEEFPSPSVLTNNALAYIYLWLCAGVMCHPEPEGPPDDKYGGMYGPLTDRERDPDYKLPNLEEFDPEGMNMIKELSCKIFGDPKDNSRTIILAAISGIQLSNKINAIDRTTKEPVADKRILNELGGCRGFHVGSYQNRLFKRCLYLSHAPTIVFLHDEKIDCPIEVGKCHFIFDKKEIWGKFISEHPLSLWIACSKNTVDLILQKCESNIKQGDWQFKIYGEVNPYPIVIGHNKVFCKMCGGMSIIP